MLKLLFSFLSSNNVWRYYCSESKPIVYLNAFCIKLSLCLGVDTAPVTVNKFGKLAC